MKLTQSLKKTLISAATLAVIAPYGAATAQAAELDVDSDVALLADGKTGQILVDQGAEKPHAIASMTKMLVEYIVHEELAHKKISWEQKITPSAYAAEISQNYELSNVPLTTDQSYTLKELYDAMAIYSANGATVAIAETIEGSEPQFVDRMKKLVKSWGIEDAKLYNTTGLNNSDIGEHIYPGSKTTDENEMSAKSIATVAYHVLNDYPEVLEVASTTEEKFREGTVDEIDMLNWNWMLPEMPFVYDGVDGLKTGTTDKAGANFTGTAKRQDQRLLSVVMGAGDGMENKAQRFNETARLFDYGFDNFVAVDALKKDQKVKGYETIKVTDGKERQAEIVAADAFAYLVAADDASDQKFTYKVEWNKEALQKDGTLKAPFKAGTEVGKVIVEPKDGQSLGFIGTDSGKGEVKLVTKTGVKEAGFFGKAWNSVRNFFSGLFDRF